MEQNEKIKIEYLQNINNTLKKMSERLDRTNQLLYFIEEKLEKMLKRDEIGIK